MRLQRERDHLAMRWLNGQGTTSEIIAVPSSTDWVWRLSVAEVVADGAFSVLPGVDRALVVATGAGFVLHVGAERHDVPRYGFASFDAGQPTECALTDGPVRDVNLMARQDSSVGMPSLEVMHLRAGTVVELGSAVAAVVLDGVLTLTTTTEVFPFAPLVQQAMRFDALLPDDEGSPDGTAACIVRRDAVVVFARFIPT